MRAKSLSSSFSLSLIKRAARCELERTSMQLKFSLKLIFAFTKKDEF
jgi:hypothetical protein